MNFRSGLKVVAPFWWNLVSPVNVIVLVIFFLFLMFFLAGYSKIDVRLPRAVTSDMVHEDNVTILITGENIMYHDGRVITRDELRAFLGQPANQRRQVFIKADRRASMGRIADVWEIGRSLGVARMSLATDQGE